MAKGILTKADVSAAKPIPDKFPLLQVKAVYLDSAFLRAGFKPFLWRLLSDPGLQIVHILPSNSYLGLLRRILFK